MRACNPREGVDLGAADLIVGTSAGAIVGAILASGGDLGRLAALPAPAAVGGGVRTAGAIGAFGPDITDLTAWAPAYRAGVRQAADAAERIRACGL